MKYYTAIIHTGDTNTGSGGFIKWRNINNKERLITSVKRLYPNSNFITLYDKQTKEKVEVISFKRS